MKKQNIGSVRITLLLALIISVTIPLLIILFIESSKQISGQALAIAELNPNKNIEIYGIIQPGGSINKCNEANGYNYCYKLYNQEGQNFWIKPSEGVKKQYTLPTDPSKFFEPLVGQRVKITANQISDPKNPTSERNYYNVKTLTVPEEFNYPTNYGIGGLGSGQGPTERADLGVKSMQPGIYWSAAQPQEKMSDSQIIANVGRYLDANMAECRDKNLDCGIFIGGVPDYAVKGGLSKIPLTCNNDYPYPIDPSQYSNLANFVNLIANRYNGKNGAPKAAYVTLFNEIDYQQNTRKPGAKPACGSPIYWTDEDLNNNKQIDSTDYVTMMRIVYDKLKTTNPEVKLGTSRFALYGPKSLDFLTRVMQASANQPFFDYMDIHYYDDQKTMPVWIQNDPYSGGSVRGKIKWTEDLMRQYGGVKPIVFSEIGYCAGPTTMNEQPTRVAKTLAQVASKDSVRDINYFTLFGRPGATSEYCGLIKENTGEKLPVYNVFKTMQKIFGGSKFLSIETSDPEYIEGYIFIAPNQKRKEIVWTNKRDKNAPEKQSVLQFRGPVTLTEISGKQYQAETKDGLTTVPISEVPLIIEF